MKSLFLITISTLISIFLTGCSVKQELHEYAYVIAIGIDASEKNPDNISVTFEFVVPIEFTNESTAEKTSANITVEAPDFYTAISNVNTSVSKQLNLSHNKIIVFSEEFAYKGLEDYVITISNDKNFRTNMYMLVSKCSAKDYITNTKAILEKNPSKFYELLLSSYEYSSYLANSYFLGYLLSFESTYAEPISAITNVNTVSIDNTIDYSSMYTPGNLNYIAGNIPKDETTSTELLGLGVFKNSKLVGALTGEETAYYLMCTNRFEQINYAIYDPFIPENIISFEIRKKGSTNIDVDLSNDIPLVCLDIDLLVNIISINPNVDYQNESNIKSLENELEFILEKNIEKLLYKTSRKYESDIFAFGRKAVKNFDNWNDWIQCNWLEIYKYSYFDVGVDVTIEKSGLVFID